MFLWIDVLLIITWQNIILHDHLNPWINFMNA